MSKWSIIKQLARQYRSEVFASKKLADTLFPCEQILNAALLKSNIKAVALSDDDPLLMGAVAELDMAAQRIWYCKSLPDSFRYFAIAHEIAHSQLHLNKTPCPSDAFSISPSIYYSSLDDEQLIGYSHKQRRELEASIFAVEMLIPVSLVRKAFLEGDRAQIIARKSGLSIDLIYSQLINSLLPLTDGSWSDISNVYQKSQDKTQSKAIGVSHGPALVIAGPGTGKTTALTARVGHILSTGENPEHILALTFSNRASDELRDRLESSFPDQAHKIWTGTFHSFGMEILRRFGSMIGLNSDPKIIDEVDAAILMERYMDELDPLRRFSLKAPTYHIHQLYTTISRCKDEFLSPEECTGLISMCKNDEFDTEKTKLAEESAAFCNSYACWQQILQNIGGVDYGDMIYRAVDLLICHPEIAKLLRKEYNHILVDEYQDINRATAILIRLIAGDGRSLWAAGDLRQAIYGFRGASSKNLEQFDIDYPRSRVFVLQENYRSLPRLVDIFNKTAMHMPGYPEKPEWVPFRCNQPGSLHLIHANSAKTPLVRIAEMIRESVSEGISFTQQAILCRTNDQAQEIADELEKLGIPVLHPGSFFVRDEIKDMLSLIQYLYNKDPIALERIKSFTQYADSTQSIEDIAPSIDSDQQQDAYHALCNYLFETSRYLYPLFDNDSSASIHKRICIQQLLLMASGLLRSSITANTYGAFLQRIEMMAGIQNIGKVDIPAATDDIDAVKVMTIHRSKGLEFSSVYLPDLLKPSRGRTATLVPLVEPIKAKLSTSKNQDEDERVMFVAMTRAKDRLTIVIPTEAVKLNEPYLQLRSILKEFCSSEEWIEEEITKPDEKISAHSQNLSDHTYSLWDIDHYLECPRRFFYRQDNQLNGFLSPHPYSKAIRISHEIMEWIRTSHLKKPVVSTDDVKGHFERLWSREVFPETDYCRRLKERAFQIVSTYAILLEREPPIDISFVIAAFPEGSIKIPIQYAYSIHPDGITVEWLIDDKPDGKLEGNQGISLMCYAFSQANPNLPFQVILRNMLTGGYKIAQPSRNIDRHIQKYRSALKDIGMHTFPAKPGYHCRTCYYRLLCSESE
jgi:superfamily I DNA/RNA helicase